MCRIDTSCASPWIWGAVRPGMDVKAEAVAAMFNWSNSILLMALSCSGVSEVISSSYLSTSAPAALSFFIVSESNIPLVAQVDFSLDVVSDVVSDVASALSRA